MAAERELKINIIEGRQGNALTQAAQDLEKLSRGVDAGDDSMKRFTSDTEHLNTEIEKSRTRIKDLHTQIAQTGDTSLFGDVRKEEARLKGFTKSLEALAPDLERAGGTAGNSFLSGMGDSFKNLPFGGVLIAGLVGIVLAALPAVGAAVAGAVTGVVGLGGIAGGIFAASKDQNVRDAASKFGKSISAVFFGSGSSFVEPVIESLDILSKDFASMDLGKSFAIIAPYVTDIAHGIGGLAKEFMPGFNRALAAAGPILAVFAEDLPVIGKELGDMFATMAESKGAAQGMRLTLATIGGLLTATGVIIGWLSDRFEEMTAAIAKTARIGQEIFGLVGLGGVFKAIGDRVDFLRQASQLSVGSFGDLGKSINNFVDPTKQAERAAEALASALKTMNDELDQWISKSLAAGDASIAVAQDFADLGAKGAKGWELNTQAGRDHQKMINQTIQDLERQRQAAIDAGNGSKAAIDAANKSYEDQLNHLLKIAGQLGATKAEVNALAGKYDVEVFMHFHSEGAAAGAIGKEISYTISHKAAGGPVMAGTPYMVGENGPELYVPSQNGTIIPHGAGNSGASGGATLTGEITYKGTGDRLVDALFEAFRVKIQAGYSLG